MTTPRKPRKPTKPTKPTRGDDNGSHEPIDDPNATGRGGDPDQTSSQPIPSRDDDVDPERVRRVRAWLGDHKRPSRQDGLWPYLLIRAYPGDTGIRQPAVPVFWESPDIRVYPGDVSDPSGATATLSPIVGELHTIFVHVWNLGRLPAVGVQVRVWWANPSFSFDASSPEPPHFIGGATVNLGDRSRADCHALVRVGTWTPVDENGGHECLLARASSIADAAPDDFSASTNRHVGQRNLMLAAPTEDLSKLLDRLGMVLPAGADLELLHGGPQLEPILIAHGQRTSRKFRAATLKKVVHEIDGTDGLGYLGAIINTPIGRVQLPSARAVPALNLQAPARSATTAVIDRVKLGAQPAPFTTGTRQVAPDTVQLAGGISGARALVEALGVRDLQAGTIARAISSRSGDGNLLRFQAVKGGVVEGGYSIIVRADR
jgi:hypothetical protein